MITLSAGEQRLLALLLRYAGHYGPESCWPKRFTIAKELKVSQRQVTRWTSSLVAFGAIERIDRGQASNKYRILWNSELLKNQLVPIYHRHVSAFVSIRENAAKVKQMRLLKSIPAGTRVSAAPFHLSPPTPHRGHHPMQMPDYYRTAAEQKLWRMAARWISENNPDLSLYTADRCAPIMELLDRAGASELPEDGPLPAITWPPADLPTMERLPARKTAASAGFVRELQRLKGGNE